MTILLFLKLFSSLLLKLGCYRFLKTSFKCIYYYFKYQLDNNEILFMNGFEPFFNNKVSLVDIYKSNLDLDKYDQLMDLLDFPFNTIKMQMLLDMYRYNINLLIEPSSLFDDKQQLKLHMSMDDPIFTKYNSDSVHTYMYKDEFGEYPHKKNFDMIALKDNPILTDGMLKKASTQVYFEDSINGHLKDVELRNENIKDSAYYEIREYIYDNVKLPHKNKKNRFIYKSYYDLKRHNIEEIKYRSNSYYHRVSEKNMFFRYNMYKRIQNIEFKYINIIKKFHPTWKQAEINEILKRNAKKYRYYGKERYYGKKF